jgi:hypothetical protein
MTATNKWLLVSESWDDSNWCTPCRGKPNQHATCFSHPVRIWSWKTQPTWHTLSTLSPCMVKDHTYLTWSTYSNLRESSTTLDRVTTPEKKGSQHNRQHAGWLIRGSVPSFLSRPNQWSSGESQTSVDSKLLGLLGHEHQHVISTFNTCSRGLTHRFLTDTGRGYNLEGTTFPHTTPRPSQSAVFTFHLRAPPGLQFNQVPSTKPKCWVQINYGHHMVFRPLSHLL